MCVYTYVYIYIYIYISDQCVGAMFLFWFDKPDLQIRKFEWKPTDDEGSIHTNTVVCLREAINNTDETQKNIYKTNAFENRCGVKGVHVKNKVR